MGKVPRLGVNSCWLASGSPLGWTSSPPPPLNRGGGALDRQKGPGLAPVEALGECHVLVGVGGQPHGAPQGACLPGGPTRR